MGEECTIGGGPEFSCCGGLECSRQGGGNSRFTLGGMGVCEKLKDDTDEEEEAKVQSQDLIINIILEIIDGGLICHTFIWLFIVADIYKCELSWYKNGYWLGCFQ